jgi:hypothetical protein
MCAHWAFCRYFEKFLWATDAAKTVLCPDFSAMVPRDARAFRHSRPAGTEFFQENRHNALGFSSMDDFIVNFSVMDPNDLLCMAWKWQRAPSAAALAATCGPRWVA